MSVRGMKCKVTLVSRSARAWAKPGSGSTNNFRFGAGFVPCSYNTNQTFYKTSLAFFFFLEDCFIENRNILGVAFILCSSPSLRREL